MLEKVTGKWLTNFKGDVNMKLIAIIVLGISLVGCGTVGGAVSGAGNDLQRAGDWIKSR